MQRRRSAFGSLADSWVIFLQIIFKMKSKICVGEISGTRQMNMLKERLKVGLVVILRDDVLGRPLHPPTATGDDALAGGFDAQDDESVLTREFVLCQQFATATAARLLLLLVGGRRRGDERGGHSERLGVAGRPGVAVRVELAFATGPGSGRKCTVDILPICGKMAERNSFDW
jgi:hypothetical protein